MNDFIARYQDQLSGTLSGFDRLVFLGTLWRNRLAGLKGYLWAHHLGAKDFGDHAEQMSKRVKEAALAPMVAANRPHLYLNSGKDDKQEIALQIAARDGVTEGPICALSAVELCSSYAIKRNPSTQQPELQVCPRKCLYVYQYWMHPVVGFMSARLQTWFPFSLHIYMNGREWLAQQMNRAAIRYRRHANCFPWIEDVPRAQELMDEHLKVNWAELLNPIARQIHPLLYSELSLKYPMEYYWTCADSEWAMDLMFRDPERLRRMVPALMQLGIVSFSSPDVLRFMGKQVNQQGGPFGQALPLTSDLKVRPNGARVKHRLGPNSLKIYDKAYDQWGAILRPEVTISVPKYFKVFRTTEAPDSKPAWRPMRQAVADIHHRAEVSQQILDRYCSALAVIDDSPTLEELTATIERRVRWKGKSVRALHPFDPQDHTLLRAVNRGEFAINGFRNRDLQSLLYSTPPRTKTEKRKRSAAISRKLRMLRAHGLIRKRQKSHRYDVTPHGRPILSAILMAHQVTLKKLLQDAA
jgi:hypothetical protein